jgi:hypothetical protein
VTKTLPLPGGKATLVDDDIYAWASRHRWRTTANGYVCRSVWLPERRRSTSEYLHRRILGLPRGLTADHITHDPPDNRRVNLRPATYGQNNQDFAGARRRSRSGARNVYVGQGRGFLVKLQVAGRSIVVGRFDTLEGAAAAATEARRRHMSHAPENVPPPVSRSLAFRGGPGDGTDDGAAGASVGRPAAGARGDG